jgi:hypothetical protein
MENPRIPAPRRAPEIAIAAKDLLLLLAIATADTVRFRLVTRFPPMRSILVGIAPLASNPTPHHMAGRDSYHSTPSEDSTKVYRNAVSRRRTLRSSMNVINRRPSHICRTKVEYYLPLNRSLISGERHFRRIRCLKTLKTLAKRSRVVLARIEVSSATTTAEAKA